MFFICLLDKVHSTTTEARSGNQWLGVGISGLLNELLPKVELHLLCLKNYYNFVQTPPRSPSVAPTLPYKSFSSSNYESTLCELTKIFLLLSFARACLSPDAGVLLNFRLSGKSGSCASTSTSGSHLNAVPKLLFSHSKAMLQKAKSPACHQVPLLAKSKTS